MGATIPGALLEMDESVINKSLVLSIPLTGVLVVGFSAAALGADVGETVSRDEFERLQSLVEAGFHSQSQNLNHTWTLVAAALVFFMQGGFLLLEAGLVRSKNSISVAQKNIADFVVSLCVFFVLGFTVMFGPSLLGLIGWGDLTGIPLTIGYSRSSYFSWSFAVPRRLSSPAPSPKG